VNPRGYGLSIVVVGASGDLAHRKIFPALFALYCQNLLPPAFNIVGFARTSFSNDQFRSHVAENLTCRYTPDHSCADRVKEFLSHCYFTAGSYVSPESFVELYADMSQVEDNAATNRIFYLAIPPSVVLDTVGAIAGAGLVNCGKEDPWSRVVIEKPFGSDRESSDLLSRELAQVFSENQTYRIDHYLGKEVIQNLMVLRFANTVFEPVWNRRFIESVRIEWKEDIGVGSRAGYFDSFGIIRDVVQNHLLQILALVAMERPVDTHANSVRDEKVRVLKNIRPLAMADVRVGQYCAGGGSIQHKAYSEEESVPRDSRTPTYAACRLEVDNERWRGVPFLVTAGKGLDGTLSEVRIRFRTDPANIFCGSRSCPPGNEFVIRIQPDEAIYLKIMNKEPGLALNVVQSHLNLKYQTAFSTMISDAYECLLLDVIKGDKSLFIREDELAAAWDIFTPVLREMEIRKVRPELYEFGTKGPSVG